MQINIKIREEEIIQNMIKLYQSPQQTRIAKAWNAIRCAQHLLGMKHYALKIHDWELGS